MGAAHTVAKPECMRLPLGDAPPLAGWGGACRYESFKPPVDVRSGVSTLYEGRQTPQDKVVHRTSLGVDDNLHISIEVVIKDASNEKFQHDTNTHVMLTLVRTQPHHIQGNVGVEDGIDD